MSYKIEIDGQEVATFQKKTFGLHYARTLIGCEGTVDHLPYRTICPRRHVVVTDIENRTIIFDSEGEKVDVKRDLPATEEAGKTGDTGGPGHQ